MKEVSIEEKRIILLNILDYIDDICRKNDLHYYLAYGTLLGAVRHKGFIPWDDIDIWLPIQEYQIFIDTVNTDRKYAVIDHRNDGCWTDPFSKVYDKRTKIINNIKLAWDNDQTTGRGIAVDIFPLISLDGISTSKKILYYLKKRDRQFRNDRKCYQGLKKIYCNMQKSIGHDESYYRNLINSLEMKQRNTKYIGCPVSPYREKDIFQLKWFDVQEMTFEKKKYLIPANYHDVLTQLYGDYMKLPPVEQQSKPTHNVRAFWKEER